LAGPASCPNRIARLREGDLRETLKTIEGPIDFALFDISTEMALLALIAPHLRPGAVVRADNTAAPRARVGYAAISPSSRTRRTGSAR
jgi:predicted O-methyltransferase YrrM